MRSDFEPGFKIYWTLGKLLCKFDSGLIWASSAFADRKKDLVKLQAGEYVSLGKVETALKMSPLVDNICMYADSSKHYAVSLVVPNVKELHKLADHLGVANGNDWTKLCENADIQKAVLKALQEQGIKGSTDALKCSGVLYFGVLFDFMVLFLVLSRKT